jgi:hypothetical protein
VLVELNTKKWKYNNISGGKIKIRGIDWGWGTLEVVD